MVGNKVNIRRIDGNPEILARIIKATCRKYNCDVNIDFSGGRRLVEFVGDDKCKVHIAEEVNNILKGRQQ